MTTRTGDAVFQEISDKIGADKVKNDEAILVSYGFNVAVPMFQKPGLVILPENQQDVIEILKVANREKIPVTPLSAGMMPTHTLPSVGGIVIDFRNMNNILEINSSANYAVIEPGVTYAEFTSALNKKEFRCHIPTAPGGTSALGIALLKPNGSMATRQLDPIVNLEIVLADGTLVRTGSAAFPAHEPYSRYVGSPDVNGIFCYAVGTMGVITKAALRIYPINESRIIHLTVFNDFKSSVNFVRDVTNHNLAEHNVIWNWQFYRSYDISVPLVGEPYIPSELAEDPGKPPSNLPYNIVTTFISGYEEATRVADKVCTKVGEKYGGKAITMEELEKLSPGPVRAWKEFYLDYHQPKMEHSKKYGLGLVPMWIAQARCDDVVEIEKMTVKAIAEIGVRPICYYVQPFDFGRAMLFRIFTFVDPDNHEMMGKVMSTYQDLMKKAMANYGASVVTPPVSVRQLDSGYYEILKRIKFALDPNNILNPGKGWF